MFCHTMLLRAARIRHSIARCDASHDARASMLRYARYAMTRVGYALSLCLTAQQSACRAVVMMMPVVLKSMRLRVYASHTMRLPCRCLICFITVVNMLTLCRHHATPDSPPLECAAARGVHMRVRVQSVIFAGYHRHIF